MRIAYLLFLAAAGVIAAFMSLESAAAVIIVATLGIATPFAFSATFFAYGLCLAPAVFLWSFNHQVRISGVLISLVLIACLAAAPPYLAENKRDGLAAQLASHNFVSTTPVNGRSIEVRKLPGSWSSFGLDKEACSKECRTLLLSGQIDWYRLVTVKRVRSKSAYEFQSSNYYILGKGAQCRAPGAPPTASRSCVIEAQDPKHPADVTLSFDKTSIYEKGQAQRFKLIRPYKQRIITAAFNKGAEMSTVTLQTEIEIHKPMFPTIIGPEFEYFPDSKGVGLTRKVERLNPVSFVRALEQTGFDMREAPGATPPHQSDSEQRDVFLEMTFQVTAVLDMPGDEPFNRQQQHIVSRWISEARNLEAWTPDYIALLRRIMLDQRMSSSLDIGEIMVRQKAVAEALTPDLAAVLETHGMDRESPYHRTLPLVMWRLGFLEPDILKPYADRFLKLLDKPAPTSKHALRLVGRLGVDPTPYLDPISADLDAGGGFNRVFAACMAEEQWRPALRPLLRAALEDSKSRASLPHHYQHALLQALVRLGDSDFVNEELDSGYYPKAERMKYKIRILAEDPHEDAQLCQ